MNCDDVELHHLWSSQTTSLDNSHVQGGNRVHDYRRSKSKVDKQQLSQQISPMNPIFCCHASDNGQHMRDLQHTELSAQLDWIGNVAEFCLNQMSVQDPLHKIKHTN